MNKNNEEMKQKPIVSIMHSQDDDTWRVDLFVTGIDDEKLALGLLKILENLFCGDEIKVN